MTAGERALPRFPIVVAGWFSSESGLVLEDPARGRKATLSGTRDEIDGVVAALGQCRGRIPREAIMDRVAAPVRARVLEALCELRDAGFVLDARSMPRAVIAELQRPAPVTDEELADIYRAPEWTDPRRRTSSHRFEASALPSYDGSVARSRSMPLEDPSAPPRPLEPGEVAALLALAYRTEGEWKPVASAGRLWPLVLHALVPTALCYDLYWFDPDEATLIRVATPVPADEVQAWFFRGDGSPATFDRHRTIVIVSADMSRAGRKYGNRGALFAVLEAGAVGHQLALSASALGMGVRAIGGFDPARVRQRLTPDVDPLMLVLLECWPEGRKGSAAFA